MNITFCNPGLIPIDLNSNDNHSWGAVEKALLNWYKHLTKLGHKINIKYINEINKDEQDIVFVHFANQALDLSIKNIPYVNMFHDHNVCLQSPNSQIVKDNFEAVTKSIITLVPGEFLVNYFQNPYKCHFFSHGVETSYFKPKDNFKLDEHKLLIVANNGYCFNPLADRKGFAHCIDAAKSLNLPLTIAGPTRNNQLFFDKNPELLKYSKLTVLYDLNETELLETYQNHTIFLNPSQIEAGQPNLTLLESLACGTPAIATYTGFKNLHGLKRINLNLEELIQGIKEVIDNYDVYRKNALETAKKHDYNITTKRLETIFRSIQTVKEEFDTQKFKHRLLNAYNHTPIVHRDSKLPEDSFIVHFLDGAYVEINGSSGKTYLVEFFDRENNNLIYSTQLKPGQWAKTHLKYFINYDIRIKDAQTFKLVYRHILNLENKQVLIGFGSRSLGDNLFFMPAIEEFRKKHNAKIVCSSFFNNLFENEYKEIKFVEPGTTIHNLTAQYELGFYFKDNAIDMSRHPIDPRTVPLQKIGFDILGLDYKEISPKITVLNKKRPLKEKYVCISTHSTAQLKFWNNPNGWSEVIEFLENKGLKVVLLQKEDSDLKNIIRPKHPNSIQENLTYLLDCEFFIGLSSGWSWAAWALGKKVILISGFTKPWTEFQQNCFRVFPQEHVCNGCWNDTNYVFDRGDWCFCPRLKKDARAFECTKTIDSKFVIEQINKCL